MLWTLGNLYNELSIVWYVSIFSCIQKLIYKNFNFHTFILRIEDNITFWIKEVSFKILCNFNIVLLEYLLSIFLKLMCVHIYMYPYIYKCMCVYASVYQSSIIHVSMLSHWFCFLWHHLMDLMLALNSWSFCFCFSSTGITASCYYTWLWCCVFNIF